MPPALLRPYVALIRFGFRLLYNELAWTYDLVANVTSLGQWWDWQRAALPHLPRDGPVLEIAHGTGHMLVEVAATGRSVFGLDASAAMGKLARRRLRRQGLTVPLVRGRVQALPIASHSLPALLATFPTEFIVDPAALAEFRRVLRPDGRLVIVPSAVLKPTNLIQRIMRWAFIVTGQGSGEISDSDPDWPPRGRAIFARHGFDVQFQRSDLPRSRVYVAVLRVKTPGVAHPRKA